MDELQQVSLRGAHNMTLDSAFILKYSLGDYVWYYSNKDMLKEYSILKGIKGVKVTLQNEKAK